jgi:hypothetical protein
MKLLFDENLSPNLSNPLSDIFSNSLHVRDVEMKTTIDPIVWDYAKDNNFTIVSKDADMHNIELRYYSIISSIVPQLRYNYKLGLIFQSTPNDRIGSISRGSSYSSCQDKPKGSRADFSRIIVDREGIIPS